MSSSNRHPQKTSQFAHYRARHFDQALKLISEGKILGRNETARLIRARRGVPVPDAMLEYTCQLLTGEIKAPQGRPAIESELKSVRDMLIAFHYDYTLSWLLDRKMKYGAHDVWPINKKADYWAKSPSETAARITARYWLYGAASWRTVQNIVSSQKKK